MSKRREEAHTEQKTLAVVGAGMAAARFVEELIAAAPGRYLIRVIGEEPRSPYNRVLLSSLLAQDVGVEDIALRPAQWWRDAGVEILSGRKAVRIDVAAQSVHLENGESIPYSKLVLATGSHALRLPIEGADLAGAHSFRNASDVEALTKLGLARKKILVIGGGLLGLEAAYGLVKLGAAVTLVHVMGRLMERQLDEAAGALLARLVEEKGVRIVLNASAARVCGRDRVDSIEFADGTTIEADAVVFAVGTRPNSELAKDAGLAVNRGVIVDDYLETNVANIYAIGECVEHRGICYGLVEPAYEQAKVLAARLGGRDCVYEGSVVATNLKVSGVRVFSAGEFIGGERAEKIICSDPRMGVYKKLVIEDGKLCGAILIGDVSDAASYLNLIRSGVCVDAIRDELMFGVRASLQRAA